jgi:hypothetical protein
MSRKPRLVNRKWFIVICGQCSRFRFMTYCLLLTIYYVL